MVQISSWWTFQLDSYCELEETPNSSPLSSTIQLPHGLLGIMVSQLVSHIGQELVFRKFIKSHPKRWNWANLNTHDVEIIHDSLDAIP